MKIVSKFQAVYFAVRLRINSMLGLPAQTKKEIQIFKAVFDSFKGKAKIRIFEWGSGSSTIYYSEYLREKGLQFEWHSIDNNRAWYEKVAFQVKNKELIPNVHLYLKEFLPFWEKPGWGPVPPKCGSFGPESEDEKCYISFPKSLGGEFDILIIDARFRRLCLQTSREVLLPDSVVIMHDAQKKHYQRGVGDFKYSRFFVTGTWYPFQNILNKIWIGSMGNNSIFTALKRF